MAAGFGSGLLLIAQAYLVAVILHGSVMDRLAREALISRFVMLLLVILARSFLNWGRDIAGFKAGACIREEVTDRLLAHLFAVGPASLGGYPSGVTASTVIDNVEALQRFFSHYLPQLALAALIPGAIAVVVMPVSWAAGGLLLLTAPLIPLFMVLVGMGVETISQRHFQALARMSAHFLDVIQGLPTLKLFDHSRREADRIGSVSRRYRQRTMAVLRVAFLSSAVLEFFSSMAIALIAVYLGMSYLGYLDFGSYGQPLSFMHGLFILLLAPDFYLPLRELGTHYHARADAVGAAEAVLELFRISAPETPAGSDPADSTPLDAPPHIRFRHVSCAYDRGRRQGVAEVSFDLAAGEHVILVGPSGAGKTTILNLLLGLVAADSGSITVDHMPLEHIPAAQWRRAISWVGQDPLLSHGTLRENITMGQSVDAAHLSACVAAAHLPDVIDDLPDGLDTVVGERGYGLSRGQMQRVALARAFAKDAPVLIMDEPTAALDADSETRVLAGLSQMARGKTVLMATHRLDHAARGDRILVVAEGRIVESGTHAALSGADGWFQRLHGRPTGQEDV